MANRTSLEKEIAQAEDRLLPKDGGESLQRRLEDYVRQIKEGDPDDRLSLYPRELFEPKPEPLYETAVEGVSDAETGTTTPESGKCLKSPVDGVQTPLQEFNYSEVKRGWSEKTERLPDGSTIKHVHLDLTEVDPDEPDDLDRQAWDWSPSIRPPRMRDVKRNMGL
ncbi:MAG: hypothetical protein QM433_05010 [Euryarchaeota archaeon]|nr:hypothetical protein [Euryarchaeota archaeon]